MNTMTEDLLPTTEEALDAHATVQTCMSYLAENDGSGNIPPEGMEQIGKQLFSALDVLVRFTAENPDDNVQMRGLKELMLREFSTKLETAALAQWGSAYLVTKA